MRIPDTTPSLQSDRAVLRPFGPQDVEGRARCGRDPEIVRMFGGTPDFDEPVPMTMEEAAAWYDEVTQDPNPLHWAVEHDGRFIGTVRLHGVDHLDRRARCAVGLLDRDVLGNGLGTDITRTVVAYGFDEVGLHRIDLRVLAYNTRAIRCYLRAGFVEEGREREAVRVDGSWHDEVIMGMLESDAPSHPPVRVAGSRRTRR